MRDVKLRGVNLGGWLVLERWITPSLFEGTTAQDECMLLQEPGAAEKVERHRQSFIVEADFKWLVSHGVNAVRIPVGYWVFDGDRPFTACIGYLDWAVSMAEKYNVAVLIDLHASKGSQNGKDHSGQIGQSNWFKDSRYRQETVAVLRRLAERYRDSPALWGIELLNEPSLGFTKYLVLRRFYRAAYKELVSILRPGTRIVFSDGFMPRLFSGALRQRGDYPPVMAVHWYQFGYTDIGVYFAALARKSRELMRLQRQQPVIVGEWSGMLSHKTLERVPREGHRMLERRHLHEQLAAYESAAGWFYWTYKTEGGGIWDFREQIESGALLLP